MSRQLGQVRRPPASRDLLIVPDLIEFSHGSFWISWQEFDMLMEILLVMVSLVKISLR